MGQEPQNTTGQREEEKIKGELKQAAEAQEVRGCIDAPFEPSTHDLKDSNSKEGRFRAWADRLFAKRRSTAVATQRTDTPKAEASQGVEVETEPAKPSEPSTDTKTESKTSISEKKPILCVCKHCNTPFVNGGLGPDYNCGGYHPGESSPVAISTVHLTCLP